jgi:predicted nuclease of predicted toxin-antitoxin system
MDFKLDENLPIELGTLLREAGHDAHTVIQEHLQGKPDVAILEACRSERRALVTLDTDFADLRTYPPCDYPGLIVLRLSRQDRFHVLQAVRRVLPLLGTEPLPGYLWIVEEMQVRIRGG